MYLSSKRGWSISSGSLGFLILTACQAPPPPATQSVEEKLEIQTEVLHQTREVLQYTIEQEAQRKEELHEIGIKE